MNEQSKLGFVYDIKHHSPDGVLVDSQHFHNFMPNEGIKFALLKVFIPTTPLPSWVRYSSSYGGLTGFYLSLFKGIFTPSAEDTMQTFPTRAEECKPEEIIYNPRYSSTRYELEIDKIIESEKLIKFNPITINIYDKPLVLTGLFVVAGMWPDVGSNQSSLLVSEALFPKPISMEVNGKITITCGCTLFSV